MRSDGLQPPFLGPQFPSYPNVLEIVRNTGNVEIPNLYQAYIQQLDTTASGPKPVLRDRSPVWLWDANGTTAAKKGGYYRGRLVGTYTGSLGTLPLYFLGLMCCAGPSSSSSMCSSSSMSGSSLFSSLFSSMSEGSGSSGSPIAICNSASLPQTLIYTQSGGSGGVCCVPNGTYPLTWNGVSSPFGAICWIYRGTISGTSITITFCPCTNIGLDLCPATFGVSYAPPDCGGGVNCVTVQNGDWSTCNYITLEWQFTKFGVDCCSADNVTGTIST